MNEEAFAAVTSGLTLNGLPQVHRTWERICGVSIYSATNRRNFEVEEKLAVCILQNGGLLPVTSGCHCVKKFT
jgi:hypothetical protein